MSKSVQSLERKLLKTLVQKDEVEGKIAELKRESRIFSSIATGAKTVPATKQYRHARFQ